MLHEVVAELVKIGQLHDDLDQELMDCVTELLDKLPHPLGEDEIVSLFKLLPPSGDTACGLNWTVLHAIEASSAWPLWELLSDRETNEWSDIFAVRLENAGMFPNIKLGEN